MPLKALDGSTTIIAPLLSDDSWDTIRNDIKQKRLTLRLACCESECFTRESKLGTRHFVHKRGADCKAPHETLEHLLAKSLVAQGASDAGWNVDVEARGNGWRADVLAERKTNRVAIEVQWSRQTLEETIIRQKRYEDAGIRCAWFFGKLPKGIEESKDLPAFKLDFTNRKEPKVDGLPLRSFAHALLSRKVKFCERMKAAKDQRLAISFYSYGCWKCKESCHAFKVNSKSMSALSVHDNGIVHLDDAFLNGVDYCREALEIVRSIKYDDKGNRVLMGEIKKRYSNTVKKSYWSQGCPHCDAIFGAHYLGTDLLYLTPVLKREFVARIPKQIDVEKPHWCYSETRDFCVNNSPN